MAERLIAVIRVDLTDWCAKRKWITSATYPDAAIISALIDAAFDPILDGAEWSLERPDDHNS